MSEWTIPRCVRENPLIVLIGTISAGHLALGELKGGRVLAAGGRALLFVVGSAYCVISTAGRAGEVAQRTPKGQLRVLAECRPGRVGPHRFAEQVRRTIADVAPGVRVAGAWADAAGFTGLARHAGCSGGAVRAWIVDGTDVIIAGDSAILGLAVDVGVPRRLAFNVAPAAFSKVMIGAGAIYILDAAGRACLIGWCLLGLAIGRLLALVVMQI